MPWHVAKSSGCPDDHPWAVIKDPDDSVVACHMSEEGANQHMKALYANEENKAGGFIERRSFPIGELRVDGKEKPTIVGHAAVYNEKSEELWGFREIIKPGAFTKTIKSADVRALWNHDANFVLGRTKSGTLELSEDNHGLAVKITPPDTAFARDMIETIKRGDVDQMSFGFRPVSDQWRLEDNQPIRELIEVDLFDVSPVTYPAYPQTDVQARSYYEARLKSLQVAPPISPVSIDLKEIIEDARREKRQEFLDSRKPILKPGDEGYLAEILTKAHKAKNKGEESHGS